MTEPSLRQLLDAHASCFWTRRSSPSSAKANKFGPSVVRFRPCALSNSAQVWPKAAKVWRTLVKFGQVGPDIGQHLAEFEPPSSVARHAERWKPVLNSRPQTHRRVEREPGSTRHPSVQHRVGDASARSPKLPMLLKQRSRIMIALPSREPHSRPPALGGLGRPRTLQPMPRSSLAAP